MIEGRMRNIPCVKLILCTVFLSAGTIVPALAQVPENPWFVSGDAIVHLTPDAFETSGPPNVVGTPHRFGGRLTAGRWLTRRSTLRVEFDMVRPQVRTRRVAIAFQPDHVTRTSQGVNILGFLLGFHPHTASQLHLGFLAGLGTNFTRRDQTDSSSPTKTSELEGHPALILGVESRYPIVRHFDVTANARLNIPFGSDQVIVRPGAGLRFSF